MKENFGSPIEKEPLFSRAGDAGGLGGPASRLKKTGNLPVDFIRGDCYSIVNAPGIRGPPEGPLRAGDEGSRACEGRL